MTGKLLLGEFLDVRPAGDFLSSPTARAANIPLADLKQRSFELPPKGWPVTVAACPGIADAESTLSAMGRLVSIRDAERTAPTDDRFRLWLANSMLDSWIETGRGRALCLACGSGREAVALAAAGWSVTAVDLLPDAIERAQTLERGYSPPGAPPIKWEVRDLRRSKLEHEATFDLITQFFYVDQETTERIGKLLAPGGIALLEAFSAAHWASIGKSQPERLPTGDAWPPEFHVTVEEGWHEGRHTMRLAVRRS